ncbi:hypothetical protein CYL16_18055 [Mycobacterium sp. EPG1]|nr:hypothetical protein CYL16_18055 [Mycobacterium sp. EPG1]
MFRRQNYFSAAVIGVAVGVVAAVALGVSFYLLTDWHDESMRADCIRDIAEPFPAVKLIDEARLAKYLTQLVGMD